jgi:hypothetical protein
MKAILIQSFILNTWVMGVMSRPYPDPVPSPVRGLPTQSELVNFSTKEHTPPPETMPPSILYPVPKGE